jgi:hypothetical protein
MGDRDNERRRRRLEGVIPEIIKRAVEVGVEKAVEAPGNLKHFVGDMKLPKEVASYIYSQVDETKNGLFRVVAKEMRDFLEHTNFAGELQKVLTTVQFEINTTIRFRPNDGSASAGDGDAAEGEPPKLSKPEVKTRVHMGRAARRRARAQAAPGATGGGGDETTSGGGTGDTET